MKERLAFLPKARSKGLITKEVDGELLVYDLDRDKAHCLNPSAAAIWKLCDGRTTTEEIGRRVDVTRIQGPEIEATGPVSKDCHLRNKPIDSDETIVWLALSDLRRSHLLEEPRSKDFWPPGIAGMSRRDVVKLIGIGIAVPAVLSITAPSARAAASCGAKCTPCGTGSECCSGTCFSGPVSGCDNTESVCT
jgi:hypothetical protein